MGTHPTTRGETILSRPIDSLGLFDNRYGQRYGELTRGVARMVALGVARPKVTGLLQLPAQFGQCFRVRADTVVNPNDHGQVLLDVFLGLHALFLRQTCKEQSDIVIRSVHSQDTISD